MRRYLQKGTLAILIEEKLTDGSKVYDVGVTYDAKKVKPTAFIIAKDLNAAQKLFNAVEENAVGVC